MGRRSSGVLAFEDSTFGSFAAIAHVPSAGFRWAVPTSPSNAVPIDDLMKWVPDGAVLNADDQANEMSDEEQSVERMLGLRVPLPQGGPWLVANEPVSADPWGYRYAPLEKWEFGQLVAKFAGLRTEKHYLEFANHYGKLRHPQQFESATFWETHTRRVRALITIWSWVKKKDREKLSWVVRWTEGMDGPTIWPGAAVDYREAEDQKRPYDPVPEGARRVTRKVRRGGQIEIPDDLPWFWKMPRRRIFEEDVLFDAEGRKRWTFGDVIRPAEFYIYDELNRAVKGHVTTKLMPFIAKEELHQVYVVPDCLLTTIYLQLQIMIARGLVNYDWKLCEANGCLNYFRPIGNQRYCSPRCRAWGRSQRNRRYYQGRASTFKSM